MSVNNHNQPTIIGLVGLHIHRWTKYIIHSISTRIAVSQTNVKRLQFGYKKNKTNVYITYEQTKINIYCQTCFQTTQLIRNSPISLPKSFRL